MDEKDLIFDWNTIDYEIKRDSSNHPHDVWFDDETLRDGLQSPSARNPTIDEKIELIDFSKNFVEVLDHVLAKRILALTINTLGLQSA